MSQTSQSDQWTLTADEMSCLLCATVSELESLLSELDPTGRAAILQQLEEYQKPPEQTPGESDPIGLHEFGRRAWAVLRPGEEFIDGEHVRAICDHLEYVTETPDYDLLVEMPPNCGKSIWTAVIWPAWVWGPRKWPEARFLFTSYSSERARDDAHKCKGLIESEWYSELWPAVELANDSVMAFALTAGGERKAAGTGGLGTGEHPHFLVCDDANKQTDSDKDFESSIAWWTGQMSTRGIVRGIGSRHVVIGQRLKLRDVPQACIDLGYDVLCLPMWAWEEKSKPTAIGWTDWRKPGELLWPAGITEEKARKVEAILGPVNAAAQLQQKPIRIAAGGLFPRSRVTFMEPAALPLGEIDKIIRYWDKAGGVSAAADRSAGVLIGRWKKRRVTEGGKAEQEIKYIIINVVSGRWNPFERDQIIEQTAALDVRTYGAKVELWIEKEARGGAGIQSAMISARDLVRFGVRFDSPATSKLLRARGISSAWHAGNVILIVGPWNSPYLEVMEAFDGEDHKGLHDDEVDGTSGGANQLILAPRKSGGGPIGIKGKV